MLFTSAITDTLAALIADRQASLFPASKTKDANKVAQAAWNDVRTSLISAHPDLEVTVVQIQSKWKSIKSNAKQEVQTQKR